MSHAARAASVASLVGFALALGGCGVYPADADGTMDRVTAGESLRVGVTENPPWTRLTSTEPDGTEAALVEEFAEQRGTDVEWREGTEEVLVDALHAGSLDIVIGGITDATPWKDKVALTDVYLESESPTGQTEKHVMLTRAGENRLLMELEVFLREEVSR